MGQHYNKLRQEYPLFVYEGYVIQCNAETLEIAYHFRIDGLTGFAPRWSFPQNITAPVNGNDPIIHKLAFYLGMVELISYWKTTCSPRVIIEAGTLEDEEIIWWKTLYYYGLGEFFYTNQIETTLQEFMRVEAVGSQTTCTEPVNRPALSGSLIPVGGGKDSAVTLDIFKASRAQDACYIINPRGASLLCAETAGFGTQNSVFAYRTLDPNLLGLNAAGYLNGHTPFSAIVAFSAVLAAYIHSKGQVVLSNESSANESTVHGTWVNHQYSKSYAFETDFRQYNQRYVGSGVEYFSILRPFNELQISRYFSMLKSYHYIFRSCNAGSKQDVWCCNCSKCLFVYLILSPFLEQDDLAEMFGANLLHKKTLTQTFEQLIGIHDSKPFECVGTIDEINIAACLAIEKIEQAGRPLPPLLGHYKSLALYQQYKGKSHSYQRSIETSHYVPASLLDKVTEKFLLG